MVHSSDEDWYDGQSELDTGELASKNSYSEVKLGIIIPLWLIVWLCALLPFFLARRINNTTDENTKIWLIGIMSMLTMFVCGVFIGVLFLDVLPGISHRSYHINPDLLGFPIGHYIIVIGILFVIILDQLTLLFSEYPIDNRNPIERLSLEPTPVIISTTVPTCQQLVYIYPTLSFLHSFLLLLALGCYSFLEGLFIGRDNYDDTFVWKLFIALFTLKIIIGFCFGLIIVQSNMKVKIFIILTGVFSLFSPIGVLFGCIYAIHLKHIVVAWFMLLIDGCSCGTFIYVLFCKILPQELEKGRFRLMKLLMIIGGFSFMCVVIAFLDIKHMNLLFTM